MSVSTKGWRDGGRYAVRVSRVGIVMLEIGSVVGVVVVVVEKMKLRCSNIWTPIVGPA